MLSQRATGLKKTGLVYWVGLGSLAKVFLQEKHTSSIQVSPSRTEWARNNNNALKKTGSERRSHPLRNLDLCKTKKPLAVQGHRARCLGKMTHN